MVSAFAEDSRNLAIELHRMFAELDRSRFKWREIVRSLPERLAILRRSLSDLLRRQTTEIEATPQPTAEAVRARLLELDAALAQYAPRSTLRTDWLAFRARVVPTYEALASCLRAASVHVPSLRPKNYVRNAFHVGSAALAVFALEFAPSWDWVIAIGWGSALAGWAMEFSRRLSPTANTLMMKLFAPVAHPHEAYRMNSATWYATSLALLALTRELIPCLMAMTVLGIGDPIAAIIGRRWGRVRWVNGRSVEGTLAFVIAAALGGTLLLVFAHDIALGSAIAIAGAAALLGAFAELYCRNIDDNLAIPVMAWSGAFAVMLATS